MSAFEMVFNTTLLTIRGQRKPLNRSLNLVEYANSKKSASRNSSRGTVTKVAALDAAKHTNDTNDRTCGREGGRKVKRKRKQHLRHLGSGF